MASLVHFVRRSIAWKIGFFLLLILVGVFSVFVTVNHLLTSRIYQDSLLASIESRLQRSALDVDRLSGSMEQKALELATVGSLFAKQALADPRMDLEAAVEEYLTGSIRGFPEGLGGGLWFEPGVLGKDRARFGPYAFWDKGQVSFTWDLTTAEYNYPSQSWYTFALPEDWDRTEARPKKVYWTAPYVDTAGSNALMITADAFMKDAQGTIIGLTTVDWSLEVLIDQLAKAPVAPGSQQFLLDRRSSTILSLGTDQTMRMKPASSLTWLRGYEALAPGVVKGVDRIEWGGVAYRGFYTATKAGFLFGSLVPEEEIARPLAGLFWTALAASTVLGLFLLVSVFLLLRGMLKPMAPLVAAVDQAAHGDLTVVLKPRSQDELGTLAGHVNTLLRDWKTALHGIRELLGLSGRSSETLLGHSGRIHGSLVELEGAMKTFARQFEALEAGMGRAIDESTRIDGLVTQELVQVGNQKASVDQTQQEWGEVLGAITSLRDQTQANKAAMDTLTGQARTSETVMHETLGAIQEIARSAELIGEMISVINDVAAQTNLLAMNAAIEAAHAGDAGRGFSVVADEIRKLAEATSGNSRQISQSLQGVLSSIRNTEVASRGTAQFMDELVTGISSVSGTAGAIARDLETLHGRGERIQGTFQALNQATDAVIASSQEITGITSSMKTSFGTLSSEVSSNRGSVDRLLSELQVLGETANGLRSEAQVNRDQGIDLERRLSRFKTE